MSFARLRLDGSRPLFAALDARSLLALIGLSAASVFAFVFSEWLFQVTARTELARLPLRHALAVLVAAPLPLILACGATMLAAWLPLRLVPPPWRARIGVRPILVAPSLLLATTLLLMVDNFTYTMWRWNSLSQGDATKFLYALPFLGAWAWLCGWLRRSCLDPGRSRRVVRLAWLAALLLVCGSGVLAAQGRNANSVPQWADRFSWPAPLPDIYFFGGDGIPAGRMSLYGYGLPTTPFLSGWAENAVVYENAFTNCGSTLGALVSIVSGRHPLETHTFDGSDRLSDEQADLHLTGILRSRGYTAGLFGIGNVFRPAAVNMRGSFDTVEASGADLAHRVVARMDRAHLLLHRASPFMNESLSRAFQRIGHVFHFRSAINPIEELEPKPARARSERYGYARDAARLRELIAFVEEGSGPLFALIHLGSTHGGLFAPSDRRFSKDVAQDRKWVDPYFDDALRDVDSLFAEFVAALERTGRYDNSLIVFYSDHGINHQVNTRVPLLIRFPHDAIKGRVEQNAQLIDVAPTALRYLQVPAPAWMGGEPMLPGQPPRDREIVSVKFLNGPNGATGYATAPELGRDPGVPSISLTRCDWHYSMRLDTGEAVSVRIPGHTAPCEAPPLSVAEARGVLVQRMAENGYPVEDAAIPGQRRSRSR